jgi:branched-chain amino acid aminotransferase
MAGHAFATFDSQKLEIRTNKQLKPLIPENELVFGKHFTDHMISIEYDAEKGWSNPHIKPYGKLELEPSAVVLHYGFEVK